MIFMACCILPSIAIQPAICLVEVVEERLEEEDCSLKARAIGDMFLWDLGERSRGQKMLGHLHKAWYRKTEKQQQGESLDPAD